MRSRPAHNCQRFMPRCATAVRRIFALSSRFLRMRGTDSLSCGPRHSLKSRPHPYLQEITEILGDSYFDVICWRVVVPAGTRRRRSFARGVGPPHKSLTIQLLSSVSRLVKVSVGLAALALVQ